MEENKIEEMEFNNETFEEQNDKLEKKLKIGVDQFVNKIKSEDMESKLSGETKPENDDGLNEEDNEEEGDEEIFFRYIRKIDFIVTKSLIFPEDS